MAWPSTRAVLKHKCSCLGVQEVSTGEGWFRRPEAGAGRWSEGHGQPCGELGDSLGREPVEEDSLCKRKGGCSDQGTAWVGFFPHNWMRKDTSTEKLQKELDRKVYSECEPPQIVKYAVPVMKGRACVWPMPTLSEKGKDAEGNCVNSERCNSELQTEIKL